MRTLIADELRLLKAKTLQAGGPFIGMDAKNGWVEVRKAAGIEDVTVDLRRMCITRLIPAGVALPTVQKLAGHSVIQTTLTYYNWTSDADMQAGVERLRKVPAG